MKHVKAIFNLLKETFTEFNEDSAPRLAAALAYYTAFSLAPLLLIVIAIVGFVADADTARAEIIETVRTSINEDAAAVVDQLLENTAQPSTGIFSTIIGVVTLLLGAIGAFGNLQAALDIIWDVDEDKPKSEGGIVQTVLRVVKDKLLSFGMLLFVGFLLLVSLVIDTALASLDSWLLARWPGLAFFLKILSIALSFGVTTLLFAMIYKFLPHVKLQWRDVLVGAAFTAFLFTIGRILLGQYLGNSATASTYGVAGAFVVILLWINYSAQILLFGAEFTQVYARRRNPNIQAKPGAKTVERHPARVNAV
jgi:membrane protein